jgi:hypothetical protein
MEVRKSYDIIKGSMNFPQQPASLKLFDGRRYQLSRDGFLLDVARRGGIMSKNNYYLAIHNSAGIHPFPDSFNATGLLPKIVYKILKQRRRHENWNSIMSNLSANSEKQRRLYRKLKKSEGHSVVSSYTRSIAKELGGGAIHVITAEYVLDGQTVIAQKCDSDHADHTVYSACVNEASFFGKYAKKIYMESFNRRRNR